MTNTATTAPKYTISPYATRTGWGAEVTDTTGTVVQRVEGNLRTREGAEAGARFWIDHMAPAN